MLCPACDIHHPNGLKECPNQDHKRGIWIKRNSDSGTTTTPKGGGTTPRVQAATPAAQPAQQSTAFAAQPPPDQSKPNELGSNLRAMLSRGARHGHMAMTQPVNRQAAFPDSQQPTSTSRGSDSIVGDLRELLNRKHKASYALNANENHRFRLFEAIACVVTTAIAMTKINFWQDKVSEMIDAVRKHWALSLTLAIVLILSTMFFSPIVVHQRDWSNVAFMAETTEITKIQCYRFYLDTCCSVSICNNPLYMVHVIDIPETRVAGVNGYRAMTKVGTMQLPIVYSTGRIHMLIINNVFFYPSCHINLVSMKQIKDAGYKAVYSNVSAEEMLSFESEDDSWTFPLLEHEDISMLPTASLLSTGGSAAKAYTFHGLCGCTYEELFHVSMLHPNKSKFKHFNGRVDGLLRKLNEDNFCSCPYSTCDEAKATRNPYPPQSTHLDTTDTDMWQWDLIDMGADCLTINDNCYASLFLIRKSRYAFVFLHKTKDEIPSIMAKAFAYAGSWPKIILSDGAGEYHSP